MNQPPPPNPTNPLAELRRLHRRLEQLEYERRDLLQSQKQYRLLVDTMAAGLLLQDENRRIIYVSDRICQMSGYAREDLIGRCPDQFLTTQSQSRYHEKTDRRPQEKTAVYELDGYSADGRLVPMLVSASAVFDENGQFRGSLAVINDISHQKKIEEDLRLSEYRYRTLFEQAPDPVVLVDAESRTIVEFNRRAVEMAGCSAQDLKGMNAANFATPEEPGDRNTLYQQILQQGHLTYGNRVRTFSGQTRDLVVSARAVKLHDHDYVQFICRDVTKENETKSQLDRFRRQMAKAGKLAALGQLGATVAHKLNQPLTTLRLLTQDALALLRSDTPDRNALRENLTVCLDAIKSADQTIRSFRSVSQLPQPGRFETIRLAPLVERVFRAFADAVAVASLQLSFHPESRPLPALSGDPAELEHIFFILIENAIQAAHTLPPDAPRRLQIFAQPCSQGILLRFADTCGGIPAEDLDRIFEPFFTTKPPGRGTGLGLPILRRITEEWGGSVHAESHPGHGTTFLIRLPLIPAYSDAQ